MVGFADTLRGDGLARAQRALAGLEGDPQRLDRARVRFDDSPPPYRSDRSGTTTRSQSPNPPSEEQRLRQERRIQLGLERRASQPYKQFEHQISDEEKRIWEAHRNRTHRLRVGDDSYEIAQENVKKRWIEQGIWNNKWNQFASGRWKHEEPLELESESETDTEAESPRPPFSFLSKEPQPKPRRAKSDEEKRRVAERRVVQEREREASRPYHQFVYQISTERERIQEESRSGEGADTADINTRAYENVKNTWTKRGIWNGGWGILPGMSWKHEEPLDDDEIADGPAPQANPVENGSHEGGQAHTRRLFGSLSPVPPDLGENRNHEGGQAPTERMFGSSPVQPSLPQGSRIVKAVKPLMQRSMGKYGGFCDGELRAQLIAAGHVPAGFFDSPRKLNVPDDLPNIGPAPAQANLLGNGNYEAAEASPGRIFTPSSPVESNHRQASSVMNESEQGLSADIDSVGLENGDAERSPLAPNSPRLRTGKRALRPTARQAARSSKGEPPHGGWQPQPVASASLGPVHSSKVSKRALKKKPGPQRRPRISENVSSGGLPLSSGMGTAEVPPLPAREAPRRSKRIQPPVSSVAKDPAKRASTDPSKRAVRSKPERKVASDLTTRSSAKPQGVSKRQPAKTTRGKARKE